MGKVIFLQILLIFLTINNWNRNVFGYEIILHKKPHEYKECPQIEDEPGNIIHLPHPNCSKFYKCSHGRPIEIDCQPGLHWHIEMDYCDHQFLAKCIENEAPAQPLTVPVEDTDSACTLNDDDDIGIPKHLPHPNCTKFYKCAHGYPIVFDCPAGLHWNIKRDYCDWPIFANCIENEAPTLIDS